MHRLLFYLIGVTWAIYSYSNVFFMFQPYLVLQGMPSEQAGILVGVFYGATTLVRPIGGWIVEKFGVRRTLIITALICFLAAACKFGTVAFWPLLFIRVFMGCAFGIFVVALTTYQALAVPDEKRGSFFALITVGSLACLFTVIPLADWFLAKRLTSLFLVIPLVMSSLCLLLSFSLPQLPGDIDFKQVSAWGTWGELYRRTPLWRTVISCVLFSLCDASIVSLPTLALAMGLVPSSFIVANGLGALLVRVWGRNFFNRYPRYYFAGPALITMAFFLYLTTWVTDNLTLWICGFLYGIGMGYGYPAHLALIGDLAPVNLRAKMSSLVHFCNDISWFLLPVYVGFFTPFAGERGAFRFLAVFCLFCGLGVSMMWYQYAKKLTCKVG